MDRTVLVLVPDDDGVAALAAVPGVRALRYDPATVPTDEQREAEVIVVGHAHVEPLTRAMAAMPRLRLVQTLNAGYDQWANTVPAAIDLSNARGAHGLTCAEWVLAVLLAHLRELRGLAGTQEEGRWAVRQGRSLAGRPVAVLGAGDIGDHVRAMLEPFGANVQLVGRTTRDDVVSIAEFLPRRAEFDVVVLALPLSDETRGLVDAEFLAGLRDGAVIVNVGRGPLVVTDDLIEAATAGRVTALLDVTDPEPLPEGHPLFTTPGVTITPHVAGFTADLWARAWRVAAEQVATYARGERPPNVVER